MFKQYMKKDYFLPIDVKGLGDVSGNVYKTVTIVSKRANQITLEIKDELTKKLAEFAPAYDNLEEVMENKDVISEEIIMQHVEISFATQKESRRNHSS